MSEKYSRLGNIPTSSAGGGNRMVHDVVVELNGNDGVFYLDDGAKHALGPVIEVALVSAREIRKLWDRPFDKGNPGTVVCQSWDGVNANGCAYQPRPRQKWQSDIKLRKCSGCETGQWVDGVKPACLPKLYLLVIIKRKEEAETCFFLAKGTQVRVMREKFQELEARELSGDMATYHTVLQLRSEKKGQNYTMVIDEEIELGADRRAELDAIVEQDFEKLWRRSIEEMRAEAMTIGVDKDEDSIPF